MARKTVQVKTDTPLRNQVVMGLLEAVRPNDWNPNRMNDVKFESIKHDFRHGSGWLESHSLTIWASDEKGRPQNIIIDGEHCWKAARENGETEGPMIFLHGLTKQQAEELTIKLDNNRGDFDTDMLSALLRDVVPTLEEPALQLGFGADELRRLLEPSSGDEPKRGGSISPQAPSKNNVTKTIPIYLDEDRHEEFQEAVRHLAEQREDLKTISDVVFWAVRYALGSTNAKAPKVKT